MQAPPGNRWAFLRASETSVRKKAAILRWLLRPLRALSLLGEKIMDNEKIKAFAQKYKCSEETAMYYYTLRDEGVDYEAALAWCGLA